MEKRGEGKEGIPVLALAKCLLVSYVLTLLLLCLGKEWKSRNSYGELSWEQHIL